MTFKKKFIHLFISLIIAIGLSCSSSSNSDLSDEELFDQAWGNFTAGNFTTAQGDFSDLQQRGTMPAEALNGLGWSSAYLGLLQTAVGSFLNALDQSPSESLRDDIYAGLVISYDALDESQSCLDASDNVSQNWSFAYRSGLDYNDIVLLRAISYYALGNFASSLLEVKRLASTFTVDINTIDGRAALAAKIEELRNQI